MVGADIYVWVHSGGDVDLTELSREPFAALAWRKRREAKEANSIAQGMKMPSFNKLDSMSLVLTMHLHTKTQLSANAQDHGSPPLARSYHTHTMCAFKCAPS